MAHQNHLQKKNRLLGSKELPLEPVDVWQLAIKVTKLFSTQSLVPNPVIATFSQKKISCLPIAKHSENKKLLHAWFACLLMLNLCFCLVVPTLAQWRKIFPRLSVSGSACVRSSSICSSFLLRLKDWTCTPELGQFPKMEA